MPQSVTFFIHLNPATCGYVARLNVYIIQNSTFISQNE